MLRGDRIFGITRLFGQYKQTNYIVATVTQKKTFGTGKKKFFLLGKNFFCETNNKKSNSLKYKTTKKKYKKILKNTSEKKNTGQ